jgi:hypothetical protein
LTLVFGGISISYLKSHPDIKSYYIYYFEFIWDDDESLINLLEELIKAIWGLEDTNFIFLDFYNSRDTIDDSFLFYASFNYDYVFFLPNDAIAFDGFRVKTLFAGDSLFSFF